MSTYGWNNFMASVQRMYIQRNRNSWKDDENTN